MSLKGNNTPWFSGKQLKLVRELLYHKCRAKHGIILCEICKGEVCGYSGDNFNYYVEHIDNDPYNWDPDNLQLSSPKCNTRKYHDLTLEKKRERGGHREPDIYAANRLKMIEQLKDTLKIDTMSMFKSVYFRQKFIEYVHERMSSNIQIPWKEIIADGAMLFGVVRSTCDDWLETITDSSIGDYKKIKIDAVWFLQWRDVNKPLKDLLNKYTQ